MFKEHQTSLKACLLLFLVIASNIFLFQFFFGGQTPFSKEVYYFSSPDSKSSFEAVAALKTSELRHRLLAFGNPQFNLLQNLLSIFPASIFLNPGYLFLLNAMVHTLCGFLVFIILHDKTCTKAAWCGATVFMLNPTHLEWTANLLKDGVFIFGCLLCIITLTRFAESIHQTYPKKISQYLFTWCIGIFFVYKSRFYFLEIIAFFGFLCLAICVIGSKNKPFIQPVNMKWWLSLIRVAALGASLFVAPVWLGFKGRESQRQDSNYLPRSLLGYASKNEKAIDLKNAKKISIQQMSLNNIEWNRCHYIPEFIENKIFMLSVRRQGFLNTAGNSKVDENIKIQSTSEFMAYLPKAFLNGWVSPFPNTWFQKGSSDVHSLGRKVLGFCTLFYWPLLVSGGIYFWNNRQSKTTFLFFGFTMTGVLFFAYLVPNIGALNRMRYGFYMLWIAFGVAYLAELITTRPSAGVPFEKTKH